MSFNSETWEWFKTAPLPVVLSMCLSSFVILGSYSWSIDKDVKKQDTVVKVAVEQTAHAVKDAEAAAAAATRVEAKIDKLTELVQSVIVEQAVVKAEKKKEKK